MNELSQNPENQSTMPSNENASMQMAHSFDNRLDLSALQHGVYQIRQQIKQVIVGQDEFIDLLLVNILANGHSLIEGVPGVAKTVTAKLVAKTIDVDFSRIQFTPDLMPSDILGTSVFNLKTNEFEFKSGPIFSNLVLIDEINRAPAKTQAALFEVMAERQITMDGKRYDMSLPFLVFATQNPIEQEGTYRLPEAQLDRFLLKIEVNYPSAEEELMIIERANERTSKDPLEMVQKLFSAQQIVEFQEKIQQIKVEKKLMKYIADVVAKTRNHADLFLGASPRASLAILSASKAFAGIQGRDFVMPEDIKRMARPALKHRVVVAPEKEMEGVSVEQIIDSILKEVEIPR